MKCPFCANLDTKVIDSRPDRDGSVIRRRRECESCSRRFTTHERVEEVLPLILKKDGRREPYDRDKVISGMKKACEKRPVSIDDIEEMANRQGLAPVGATPWRTFRRVTLPGILPALIVAALGITRERELGTLEQLLVTPLQFLFAAVDLLDLAVEILLLLHQALFLPLQFAAQFLDLVFPLGLGLEDRILGLDLGFLADGLRFLAGILQLPERIALGIGQLRCGRLAAQRGADQPAADQAGGGNQQYNRYG